MIDSEDFEEIIKKHQTKIKSNLIELQEQLFDL